MSRALLLFLLLTGLARAETADLVLRGGDVYTVDASRSWARAVAVKQGRILFVGENADAFVGPGTRVVELEGRMVLPGFHDSHVHPALGGVEQSRCPLTGSGSVAELEKRIEEYSRRYPELPWVLGTGWDTTLFPDGGPDRQRLDALVPDRPAWLKSSDDHSGWANSQALELAGVDAETPDPPGGRIERDAAGHPTGLLQEAACELVERMVPPTTASVYAAGAALALKEANRFGITSLQEANADRAMLEGYRATDLTARVTVALKTEGVSLEELERLRREFDGEKLRVRAAKIFMDGVVESRTAALLEPYLGGADRGLLKEGGQEMIRRLDQAGFQVHVHAIGDAAVREALDAFGSSARRRHHIAHLELVHPDDVPRFRELGVVANFQPLWAYRDAYVTELTEPVLGPERSARLYPMGSLARSGATIAAGSDWTVSSLNPLEAIEVAVTRRDPSGEPGPAWLPDERLTLAEALAAYTINGAYLAFREDDLGSIEVGKLADLVVLERNLFEIPPHQIGETGVVMTLLEGEVVWSAPGLKVSSKV